MDSADKFSLKKKKDLVAIITQFGLMTEEKANRLTKQDLVDFLNDQERKTSDVKTPAVMATPEPVTENTPVNEPAEVPVDEPAKAKEDRPVKKAVNSKSKERENSSVIEPIDSPDTEIHKTTRTVKKTAPVVSEPEIQDVMVIASGNGDISFVVPGSSKAEPVTGTVPETLKTEIPVSVREDETHGSQMPDDSAAPEAELPIKHRGRPKKKSAPSTEDSVITEDILSIPETAASDLAAEPAIVAETAVAAESAKLPEAAVASEPAIVAETDKVPESAKAREPELRKAPETAEHSAAEPSSKPHAGRSRKHSVIIKPKDEQVEIDEVAEEASDLLRDYREDQESMQETAAEDSESGEENAPSEDQPTPSHHNRTLRPKEPPQEMLSGVLEIMSEGYGFLRRENYLQGSNDIYVPQQYVRRFQLRLGDYVTGPCRPKRETDRYPALQYIKEVNGMPPEKMLRRPHFDRLTPIYPNEKFTLETEKNELSTRIIDLVAPIGKGQRGMIVSPPKAGKTILLQKIANAISINNPECKLIVLLIDERPEEVTDMQRSINGEVVYSTFDKTPENHVRITELVLERAMRLVELGQDVIILMDSITRMSRAYNLTINPTGRTLSGGLDPGALYGPKRFFGAARNIEDGGSLTIIATSLIETGSRMDEVIFEEFKGTGNMEVCLDRKLSEKRIFPAIDIIKSGTRREELLLSAVELDAVWTIRKAFSQLDTAAVTEMIISLLMKTNSNNQFVQSVNVSFNDKATFDAMRGTRLPGTQNQGQSGGGNGK